MSDYLVGVDYGTGGAKLSLIDAQGNEAAYAFEEYPLYTDRTGWSEHSVPLYWEIFCRMTQKALSQSGINPKLIRGIAISSALPSMVMLLKDRSVHARAYNLMDRRATEQVQWIKDKVGEERVFQICANRLEDHPTLVNLLWERENRPALYEQIDKALTIDGFISYQLTGRAILNVSGAAFYGVAYDLLEKRFDADLLAELGISAELLPELVGCEEIIGVVSEKAAAATGLAAGTPVAGGQVDCNAGWVGGGAISPGNIQMNLGTCGNFGVIHTDTHFLFSPTGYTAINFPYTVDSQHTYITVPTTTTGGQSLRYIRDNFSALELAAEENFGLNAYDLLNDQAKRYHWAAKA